MRKLVILFLAVAVVAVGSSVYAASVGNGIEPLGNMKAAVGIEENYVFKKEIEKGGNLTSASTSISSYDLEYSQLYGKASLGLGDYCNVYTKLGTSKIENADVTFASGSSATVETDYNILWGLGANGAYKMGDFEPIILGASLEYNMWKADVDTVDVTSSVNATQISGTLKNSEIQLSLYAGKEFSLLMDSGELLIIPYVAGIYDKFNTETDGAVKYTLGNTAYELTYDLDAKDEFGIAVGVDVKTMELFMFNIEGRFFHEQALTVGGSYRF